MAPCVLMSGTMRDESIAQGHSTAGPVQAAVRLAHRLGIGCVAPRLLAPRILTPRLLTPSLLHESWRVSVRLFPHDVVAKVVRADDAEATRKLSRELGAARHLVQHAAPVVAPSSDLPAGPHFQDGFVVTFWDFVEHIAADEDNPEHVAKAAEALRRVHQALAGFRGELPDFWLKIDRCRMALENSSAIPAIGAGDRAFLHAAFNRLRASMTGLPVDIAPIHGDAHLGNVFITPEGARWNDFEDVCLGPREWDIGWLPETRLAAFEPVNRDALATLGYLRSLCVSVWCWEQHAIPEKREAAEYHLEYLRKSRLFELP
jgi:Phosphotransferase enzyme family